MIIGKKEGINHEITPYSPESIGVAERKKYRTLK